MLEESSEVPSEGVLPTSEVLVPLAGQEVPVTYLPEARTFFQKRRRIHARRIIPTVPEGMLVNDFNPDAPSLAREAPGHGCCDGT